MSPHLQQPRSGIWILGPQYVAVWECLGGVTLVKEVYGEGAGICFETHVDLSSLSLFPALVWDVNF